MTYLQEGDIIEITGQHSVYAMIPKHFVYTNKEGCWDLTRSDIKPNGQFSYMQGRYLVTRTQMDGGGTGHGPNDVFPDGHHVFCEHLENGNKIDFYQSGCFTAMIRDIDPVGRAEKKWVAEGSGDRGEQP